MHSLPTRVVVDDVCLALSSDVLFSASSENHSRPPFFTRAHARRRYQWVLSRVLFCGATRSCPQTGEVQCVHFYKDGSAGGEQVSDPALLALVAAGRTGDYNIDFWEIRRIVHALSLRDPAYSFSYDAGLQDLLRLGAG